MLNLQKQEPEASTKQKYSSTNNLVLATLINKEQLMILLGLVKIGYKKGGNYISKLKTQGIFLNYRRISEIHGCSKKLSGKK